MKHSSSQHRYKQAVSAQEPSAAAKMRSVAALCLACWAGSANCFVLNSPAQLSRAPLGFARPAGAAATVGVAAGAARVGPRCLPSSRSMSTAEPEVEEFTDAMLDELFELEQEPETYPDTELTRKYGHLRGADIKPVGATMQAFNKLYRLPVLPNYRVLVTEILQSTHLSVVDARFGYDAFFAFGLVNAYNSLMGSYPRGQKDVIFDAIVRALDFDTEKVLGDAEKLGAFLEGKTGDDMLKTLRGEGDDEYAERFKVISGLGIDFKYNRMWAIGMITAMKAVNVEPTEDSVKEWFDIINVNAKAGNADLDLFNDSLERIAEAEQMYKEIEIREKKKMAERLEEKAKKALEAAKEAEAKEAAVLAGGGEEDAEKTETAEE